MRPVAALMSLAAFLLLAGCVRQSGGDDSLLPIPPSSSPVAPLPSLPPAQSPIGRHPASASPSATGFPESYVVSCAGRPSADQVIAVVRRQPSLLPSGASVTVTNGPLCSGTWQYTVLTVTDREPLQVVTRGAPLSLTFVTAGTDVCTIDVRTGAPVALLTIANC
jgi:hypothetical protein